MTFESTLSTAIHRKYFNFRRDLQKHIHEPTHHCLGALCSLALFSCSPYKKIQTVTAEKLVRENYSVLKKDNTIKEGPYSMSYRDKIITKGAYTQNKKTGLWEYYNLDDSLRFSGTYDNGVKNGKWTYYYKGQLSSEIYYRNGVIDSLFGYGEDGKPISVLRYNDDNSGIYKAYHKNGRLKEEYALKNRRTHGVYRQYYENGQLYREVEFAEGKKVNVLATYNSQGKPINGGTLKNGNGTYIDYYMPESQLDTASIISSVTNYEHSSMNGPDKSYNRKGKLTEEGQYANGVKSGAWKKYNDEGKVVDIVQYNAEEDIPLPVSSEDNTAYGYSPGTADVMHDFQGGNAELARFLQTNVQYPSYAMDNNIQGKVYVSAVINQNGEIESCQIINKVHPALDQEVVRIIKLSPRWSPGLHDGVPVKTRVNLPVNFKLQ